MKLKLPAAELIYKGLMQFAWLNIYHEGYTRARPAATTYDFWNCVYYVLDSKLINNVLSSNMK